MNRTRIGFAFLAATMAWSTAQAAPPPTVQQILQFKPRQQGVVVGNPSEAEQAKCSVDLVKGQKLANGKTGSGWMLKDPQGRMLRRFFDSDGDNQIDVYSYYLNGDECYRELDANYNGKVDQYRWLGGNGSKWGVDLNEDGKIDGWKAISAEEASQEILAAVKTKDLARLQALMLIKADFDALELPDSEANRIKTKSQTMAATFQTTCNSLAAKLNEKTKWVHLETAAPECIPADALGSKADLIRHRQGTILYSDGEKINDFLQTGEMILVGKSWHIIEAPVAGGTAQNSTAANMVGGGLEISDDIKDLVEKLKIVDEKYKANQSSTAKVIEYNLARAAVLEEIVAKSKPEQREEWLKQAADSYATAAQNGDKSALPKLIEWVKKLAKDAPMSNLAGYVTFRQLSSEYALRLMEIKPEQMQKLQEEWKEMLAKFVQDYPSTEDAPDALMQLGMVTEFIGKETEAKNWYGLLVKNYEKNPMAPKAAGAIRRLTCENHPFELTSQTLGAKAAFDIKSLKGKNVVVYYWASWNSQCVADIAKLKALLASPAGRSLELVCVNLDNTQEDAMKFLQANPVGGTHLHQAGGQDSAPAIHYGIMVLPNTFLVDAEGKVANRNAQVATIEEDLKKLMK